MCELYKKQCKTILYLNNPYKNLNLDATIEMQMTDIIGPPKSSNLSDTTLDKIRKILIVAEYRGGSSFASEMFNRNPFASFFFEPFYMAENDPIGQNKILETIFGHWGLEWPEVFLTFLVYYSTMQKHYFVKNLKLFDPFFRKRNKNFSPEYHTCKNQK